MTKPSDRLTAAQRGYGYRWQKYREEYLREHPLCVSHKKRQQVAAATVVDHIVPPRMAEALASRDQDAIATARKLFWDPSNHQALCKTCHDSEKQRLEKSGRVAGCDESGTPVDPNHHWNIHS